MAKLGPDDRLRPDDVHYLAFEGGGGCGFAFIGAVRALRKLGVLPISLDQPGQNQIWGVSGASAGAITALFVALGMDDFEVERFIAETDFGELFDAPACGTWRSVDSSGRMGTAQRPVALKQLRVENVMIETAARVSTVGQILEIFGLSIDKENALLSRLLKNGKSYMQNLLFDRGIFPGFAAREMFQNLLREKLEPKRRLVRFWLGADGQPLPPNFDLGKVDFATFKRLTGVDLAVTGSNLTTSSPGLFSSLKQETATFPVAEAVGLSMSLPFLFKPVEISWRAPTPNGTDFSGFWVDGGLQTNLPLHAFNDVDERGRSLEGRITLRGLQGRTGRLAPLNPHMLGLRLSKGPDPELGFPEPKPGIPTLLDTLGRLIEAAMYGSELGQIRSPAEAQQVIEFLTYDLSLTNFTPDKKISEKPVEEAYKQVMAYFR